MSVKSLLQRSAFLTGLLIFITPVQGNDSILVEINYQPSSGGSVQLYGDLTFESWPMTTSEGEEITFTPRQLRATQEGQIRVVKVPEEEATFTIHHRRGETTGSFPFDRIPVQQADTATAERALDRGLHDDIDDLMDIRLEEDPEEEETGNRPLTLLVDHLPQRESLEVNRIASINVLVRPGDEPSPPTGRFVQYNRAATGSERVRLIGATLFGGEEEERFMGAAFSPDEQAIWAVANIRDSSFANIPQNYPGGASVDDPSFQVETGTLVHYSADLQNLERIVRLPEGSAFIEHIKSSRSGQAVYISGRAQGQFGEFAEMVDQVAFSEKPEEEDDPLAGFGGGRQTDPFNRGGSFIARLHPQGTDFKWIAYFPGITRLQFDFGPEDNLLVQSQRRFWHLTPEGDVSEAPSPTENFRARVITPVAVSPVDGSFYMGGEYHSGTGLEPWRNPFLHRFKADGEPVWTAWNWTGPLVGVQWSRQVSDSAVRHVLVEDDGQLLIRGWSDGGNSVFTNLPYDFRRSHGQRGFAGSVWGANVLSVSYLMRMDPESMEITAFNRWLAYSPSTGDPNTANIRSYAQTENREVVFTGSTAASLIETHNAFVEPWYLQNQRDPDNARPKGGPYLAIFDHDFKNLLLSTSVPGLRQPVVQTRGQKILLSGRTLPMEGAYGINLPPLTKNAPQEEFGGGSTDAYLMLITIDP